VFPPPVKLLPAKKIEQINMPIVTSSQLFRWAVLPGAKKYRVSFLNGWLLLSLLVPCPMYKFFSLSLFSEQAIIKCVAITMTINLQIEESFICLSLLSMHST